MRKAIIERKTSETDISLSLSIDGDGANRIDSGCGFLNHMLSLFAFHGRFDLFIGCKGDTHIDDHHTVEDVGIALGQAFDQALGARGGIARYGSFLLPMDEALILCALDLSGRAHLSFEANIPSQKVGSFDTELVREFLLAFTRELGATAHIRQLSGENSHHIIEAMFKALGRAMRMACAKDGDSERVPSSKGMFA